MIQSCGSLLRYVCNEFTFVEDRRVEELDLCLSLLKALWSYQKASISSAASNDDLAEWMPRDLICIAIKDSIKGRSSDAAKLEEAQELILRGLQLLSYLFNRGLSVDLKRWTFSSKVLKIIERVIEFEKECKKPSLNTRFAFFVAAQLLDEDWPEIHWEFSQRSFLL